MANILQQGDVWHLAGDVIIDDMPALLLEADALMFNADKSIDLSEVVEVDTSAISFLLELQRRANQSNVRLALAHLPDNLKSLMQLYGVENFLAVH